MILHGKVGRGEVYRIDPFFMSPAPPHHQHGFSAWLDSLHLGEAGSATGVVIVSLITFFLFFAAIFSVIWVFFDARARQKSGCIAIILILLVGWPLSFIWWFWLRPPLERAKARTTRRRT
jgi:hypothetical protein